MHAGPPTRRCAPASGCALEALSIANPVKLYVQSLKFAGNLRFLAALAADKPANAAARKVWQVGASAAAKHQHALALRPATQTDAAFLGTVYRSVREPELQAMGWPEAQIEDFCNLQHHLRTAG